MIHYWIFFSGYTIVACWCHDDVLLTCHDYLLLFSRGKLFIFGKISCFDISQSWEKGFDSFDPEGLLFRMPKTPRIKEAINGRIIFMFFKIASCFAIENKTMKNKSKPRYNKLVVYHNTRYWTSKYLITMRIWYVCYKVRLQPFWLLVWEQWKDSVLVSTAYSSLHTHVTAVM